MCRSLARRNDECESLVRAQQEQNDKLHLQIRDSDSQIAVKDKDMEFLREAVRSAHTKAFLSRTRSAGFETSVHTA